MKAPDLQLTPSLSDMDLVMPPISRKRRDRELRVRSGCWKCRERRVKCPEQRPICHHCKRLGLICQYEVRLTWTGVTRSRRRVSQALPARKHGRDLCAILIEEWMFLNTTSGDFDHPQKCESLPPRALSPVSVVRSPTPTNWSSPYLKAASSPIVPRCLATLSLPPGDAPLWGYFVDFITPRCALGKSSNPYRDIIMRIAAGSLDGPLFQCIMAASEVQMQSLGHGGSKLSILSRRKKALASLRNTISTYESASSHRISRKGVAEQIISSTVMMCFFEILHDCSQSWEVHADFARSFLLSRALTQPERGLEHKELHEFAAAYFRSHDILASTVSAPRYDLQMSKSLDQVYDHSAIETLTGCSKELMELVSEITDLGFIQDTEKAHSDSPRLLISQRRDNIERRLHILYIGEPGNSTELVDDLACVAETKRLATLMYLYARIDNLNPFHANMIQLTSRLLAHVPNISLRTNTLLWPLFMVATLGIRPESDDDRKFVLERLDALQQTRQLGNVRKARCIIEDVWKARDLRTSDAMRGWDILAGRLDTISLA